MNCLFHGTVIEMSVVKEKRHLHILFTWQGLPALKFFPKIFLSFP